MSYSYIKSVFPNFENSNKVYDESLYSDIDEKPVSPKNVIGGTLNSSNEEFVRRQGNVMVNLTDFSKTLSQKNNDIDLPQEKLIESYRNIEGMANGEYAEIKPLNPSDTRNNLKYYNKPLSTFTEAGLTVRQQSKEKDIFENFTDDKGCNDSYVKHVIECNRCKTIAMKTFGIETDRIRNEEIMELISYILFGLFILMLIDSK
jgi:hypothetical protein